MASIKKKRLVAHLKVLALAAAFGLAAFAVMAALIAVLHLFGLGG